MRIQIPDVAFSAVRYSATSAVPQTPQLVRDGSADKSPRATLQKVVISIGRRSNLRGMDKEKVRTVRVETWPCSTTARLWLIDLAVPAARQRPQQNVEIVDDEVFHVALPAPQSEAPNAINCGK